jgi:hypothetical protein
MMMDADSNQTTGAVLSHVEAVYRPGDRQLAIDLFEVLGCKTYDSDTKSLSGSTYISVHPDPGVRGMDDVLYLSEMTAEQSRMEQLLRQQIESNDELRAAHGEYRTLASERPFGLSHVAVRYPTYESLEKVLDGLEDRLSPEMKRRSVLKVFRPGDAAEIQWESVQAFLYTDIAVSGVSAFGQVFELSAYGEFSETVA